MTYVLVLTSTDTDLYYEQALMAAYSFRLYMPNENLTILVDNKTFDSFVGKRTALNNYATRIISVSFDDKISNRERSRLIKTSIPNYIDDDFLYMDCDMIICGDLSDIQNEDCELGGVLDCHCHLDEHIHKDAFLRRDKKLGFHGTASLNGNFNGGLVWAKKGEVQKELFKNWNEFWKYSAYKKHDFHDQPCLNEANWKIGMKMKELSGIWNCQPSSGGLAFLGDAKIIHYFSSEFDGKNYAPYYKLADRTLQMRIKESGDIPDDIKAMIENPRFQFNKVYLIKDQRIVSIMQSPLIFTFAEMKVKLPALFKFFEGGAACIRAIGKKIKNFRKIGSK
ncbi:MAG: glycosyl transferase [Treponema sp.]|nr:glycosyl transferase [Treponema sp.]MBD5409577.1 glycosyl transferase [Treponema sp.]MDE6245480.1 glycosyl transferase [Treponemataceae bacterium]